MKLSTTILSATLLAGALALAGCGGSSNGGTDDEMESMPSAEDQCTADGGLVYEDGECKTREDIKKEGADERDAEAAEEAREAMAKKLRDLLEVDTVMADDMAPTNAATTSDHLEAALMAAKSADNGEGMKEKAHVMVYNNKGPMIKVDTADPIPPTSAATTVAQEKHIMGTGFATGTAEIKEHKADSVVRGSYMGATGGYVCGADADCQSQRTKDGIRLTGLWTFDPDRGQKYDADDARYAEWGWWIDESIADGDGDTPNDKVGAWYLAVDSDIMADDVSAASGKATYKGQAVGKAAFHHSLSDSNVGGAFTADAELNADFDAGNENGKLTGSITGFDIDGVKPDWSVELVGHDIASTGVAAANSKTKWTVDGITDDANGSWSAKFYDVPKGQHQPMGVAGGFEAEYESDGYMVGAFGAER